MDLIFTCFCCGCFILNMMFARFKFVVKRYCVHAFYKSRALTGHSVFRLFCVVTLFKYIHGAASEFQLSDLWSRRCSVILNFMHCFKLATNWYTIAWSHSRSHYITNSEYRITCCSCLGHNAVTFNHLMLPTVTMRMWLLIISLITMWLLIILLITTWLPCVCDYWLYYWLPHDYHAYVIIDYIIDYHMITMRMWLLITTWLPCFIPHDYLISLLFSVNFEVHCVVVVQY
jgi:hypothetical protein